MSITPDQVRHVAKLARLDLSEDEVVMYTSQLDRILEYMEILNKLDTANVEPTAQVTGLVNVSRDDQVILSSNRDELLGTTQLPVQDNQIRVHSVF